MNSRIKRKLEKRAKLNARSGELDINDWKRSYIRMIMVSDQLGPCVSFNFETGKSKVYNPIIPPYIKLPRHLTKKIYPRIKSGINKIDK